MFKSVSILATEIGCTSTSTDYYCVPIFRIWKHSSEGNIVLLFTQFAEENTYTYSFYTPAILKPK